MAAPGIELIVGVTHDPLFGPLVLLGMGGIAAELTRDTALRIVPLSVLDAHQMVRSLRSSPLLFGYRNTAEVDVAAIEAVLVRIGQLAEDLPSSSSWTATRSSPRQVVLLSSTSSCGSSHAPHRQDSPSISEEIALRRVLPARHQDRNGRVPHHARRHAPEHHTRDALPPVGTEREHCRVGAGGLRNQPVGLVDAVEHLVLSLDPGHPEFADRLLERIDVPDPKPRDLDNVRKPRDLDHADPRAERRGEIAGRAHARASRRRAVETGEHGR